MPYPIQSVVLPKDTKLDVTEIVRQAERQRAVYLASLIRGLFARLGHAATGHIHRPASSRG